MKPEKMPQENEQLEIEEQSIGEPMNVLEQDETRYKTVAEMDNDEIDTLIQ